MTEETPGFEEQQPDVPSGATSDDAEPKAAAPGTPGTPEKGRRPRPGTVTARRV